MSTSQPSGAGATPAADTVTYIQTAERVAGAIPPAVARLAGTLTLRDGTRVHVRPIRPDDTERLRTFHAHLSRDTVIYRFFRYMPDLSIHDAERFTHLDYQDRVALVATLGTGEEEHIVAVVRYDRIDPEAAEVAFVVADAWQGHGIATALLLQLAGLARAHGITRFVAITMASNRRMLEVLRHCGFPTSTHAEHGEDEVSLDISAPPAPVLAPLPFLPDAVE